MKAWLVLQCGYPVYVGPNAVGACRWLRDRLFTATNRRRRNVRIKDFEVQEWHRGLHRRSYKARTMPNFAEIELCEKLP